MKRDILFLLAPGFSDNDRREYCPECAEIWGLLHYFPALRECVEINCQEITKPRRELEQLLGKEHQNCPTLLLSEQSPKFDHSGIQHFQGRAFIDNARDIGLYYAQRFGTPSPRGHRRTHSREGD